VGFRLLTAIASRACGAAPQLEVTVMRRKWLLSLGAVALAVLGAQHHNLMMAVLAVGLGSGGMSLMTDMPLVRDTMLAMSLVMVAVIAWQITRPKRPAAVRLVGALSILLTLAIAGWTFLRFGL
jgi:hypothetical protein